MIDHKEAKLLLSKFGEGKCTAAEKELLESWYNHIAATVNDPVVEPDYEFLQQRTWKHIRPGAFHNTPFRRMVVAAAAIIIVLGGSLYYFRYNSSPTNQTAIAHDIKPGGSKATLILASGASIALNSDKEGIMINETSIAYNDGSKIAYSNELKAQTQVPASGKKELTYNRIVTPKGGQYQITLADGTKVWLNAASTLRYPTTFAEDSREVELEGEAYFSVKPKIGISVDKIPFIVKTKEYKALVLGTEFNVSAYNDENTVITTLVNGALKISMDQSVLPVTGNKKPHKQLQSVLLKPGEESLVLTGVLQKQKADVQSAIAWKSGVFQFNDQIPFRVMMRQIARWYDIDVQYNEGIPDIHFTGKMSRGVNLSTLITFLKDSGIDCRLEGGRKLIVNGYKEERRKI